jgi:threonine synthase
MRPRLALIAVCALCAWPLAAQESTSQLGRLDAATRAAVLMLVDSARAGRLPVEPLVAKALEGANKGATGERIVAAVRALVHDLEQARTALGAGSSDVELEIGAEALRTGAPAAALAALRARRPRQSLAVPISVLIDLVAAGVPADSAAGAVLAVADRLSDERFLGFRRDIERSVALGASPAAAAGLAVNAALREGGVVRP